MGALAGLGVLGVLGLCTAYPTVAVASPLKSVQVLQLTGTPALDDLARSITDSVGSLVTLAAFGVILAFWVTIFVNWLVGFQTEKRRSDKYYYNSYNYPNYGQRLRPQGSDSSSVSRVLHFISSDSFGSLLDSLGSAMDVRPTISRMGSGAADSVNSITNALASGVSNSVVGTVGAVSDGVDAVTNGVTGSIKAVGSGVSGGINAVGNGVTGGIRAVGNGVSGGIRAVNNGVTGTVTGVKNGVSGGIRRVSTGVSSSLEFVTASAQALTGLVGDQKVKDCLLQTVCYLTPLSQEEKKKGFTGRKKTKEERHKNKGKSGKKDKKDKKKNKKDKKDKKKKKEKIDLDDLLEDEEDDEYYEEYEDDYEEDYEEEKEEEKDEVSEEDKEEEKEETVEDCEVFKCPTVSNGFAAYKLYRSINNIRQKLDI